MPTFQAVLADAEKKARLKHMETSAVKILLLHESGMTSSQLYLSLRQEMPASALSSFQAGVHRYLELGEPVQYIVGYVYFYGYKFAVGPNVLIPRFETEELVANVLIAYDETFSGAPVRLVDIGTGSGCLAIALQKEEPKLSVTATDISQAALETARLNARNLGANITFLHGDMLEPLHGQKFDMLVSNPPYIPELEVVDPIIANNEPSVALYGGEDGLKFYRIILANAKPILNARFVIAFEHAYDKKTEIQALAKAAFPMASIETVKDMQGKDRMTIIIQQ
jgi:release factor glutamine methyltransferase